MDAPIVWGDRQRSCLGVQAVRAQSWVTSYPYDEYDSCDTYTTYEEWVGPAFHLSHQLRLSTSPASIARFLAVGFDVLLGETQRTRAARARRITTRSSGISSRGGESSVKTRACDPPSRRWAVVKNLVDLPGPVCLLGGRDWRLGEFTRVNSKSTCPAQGGESGTAPPRPWNKPPCLSPYSKPQVRCGLRNELGLRYGKRLSSSTQGLLTRSGCTPDRIGGLGYLDTAKQVQFPRTQRAFTGSVRSL